MQGMHLTRDSDSKIYRTMTFQVNHWKVAANPRMLQPKSSHTNPGGSFAHHQHSRCKEVGLQYGQRNSICCTLGEHATLAQKSGQRPLHGFEGIRRYALVLHVELVESDPLQAPLRSSAQPHSTHWSAGSLEVDHCSLFLSSSTTLCVASACSRASRSERTCRNCKTWRLPL